EIPEVGRDVRVLARGDLEPGRAAVTEEPEPLEVGRADWLLEPRDAPFPRVARGPAERLLPREGAVRVHEELRAGAERRPGGVDPHGILVRASADLHLHDPEACLGPGAELLPESVA